MLHLQEGDLRKLESMGVDALFQPQSLYATGQLHE
jgi:hypothetical protein